MSKKVLKSLLFLLIVIAGVFIFLETYTPSLSENHGKVDARLYLGSSVKQPLIVGFGGSEGGNAWDSDYWKSTRDQFLSKGYAFLAVGYFGGKGTPDNLDRISLNAIHDAILEAAKNPKIDNQKIAVIGGSKGGELALNLASHFDDIDAVVAMSASHVSFPGITWTSNTSSWTLNNEELPYVPAPYAVIPAITSGNHLEAYNIMLKNTIAEKKALIPVEKINGSVLLLSATNDEAWPSKEMSDKVMARLKNEKFNHHFEHIVLNGGHTEPAKHFDKIFAFLEKYFKSNQ